MKKYMKYFLIITFLVVCVGLGIKYGSDMRYRNELNKIYDSKSTALDDYYRNKNLVISYLQVYDIIDENSYQHIKNDMYNNFSSEMQDILFPTTNYTGISLHSMTTELIRCIGTNNSYSGENTFLLEYNLKGVNYNQNITNLISLKNGLITNVIRIK